ncbi:sensor histidine kinase [Thaumasiovibrio subtropicus]|uniref:sensor histidine kinase n=1 Tax=Thaumasiovibrio subtropicus TaxID=1891207 RepID=UPI000B34AD16|nr:HAMP domain-containing sensor histidine kinase [Thaumasiovibrio subtropicus]
MALLSSRIFNSMIFRVSIAMLTVILLAELLAGFIWYKNTALTKRESAHSALTAVTTAAADTYNYFHQLPVNYRHLVLNQLRDVGGTRFFISINNQPLDIPTLDHLSLTAELLTAAELQLQKDVQQMEGMRVSITRRDEVKLFNAGIKLAELPELWTKYSLVLGELDLPIVVIQIQMSEKEWFYLATVLPLSFSALTDEFISQRQVLFLFIVTAMLMLCSYVVLQKEIRPFKSLARSATLMGAQMRVEEIEEEGSVETRAAIHAFNKMNRRIKAYLLDREMLFSAISHDLKTPLACLKLRTEMLDDEQTKARFEKLLGEVEMMLKGALQCIRDTDIHEEPEWVNMHEMFTQCADYYNREKPCVTLRCEPSAGVFGKPLAIKRLVFNLVDNAIKYGDRVEIDVLESDDAVGIILRDGGPGIDNALLEKVFEPYFRAEGSSVEGTGMGLSISRSIARSHGGDIKLSNHPDGGLVVDVVMMSIV